MFVIAAFIFVSRAPLDFYLCIDYFYKCANKLSPNSYIGIIAI